MIVLRSDKVKEGLKFDTSFEELLDQLEPILPNTPDEYTNNYMLHTKGDED